MPLPDILVTAPLPPFLYDPLKATYECHDYVKATDKAALVAAQGKRIRGLVQGGGTVNPLELLDALPALEIISVFGVGYDGVPVAYCRKRGIKVTNTPDVLTEEVADTALGLLLCTVRELPQAERHLRSGKWRDGDYPLTRATLRNRIVGLVGMGRIDATTLTSSEGADNLWAMLDSAARSDFTAVPAFVPHVRIADRARALGIANVIVTAPADAGLIAALLTYFERPGHSRRL